jgi:molybdopterin-synthase adenylyltransferase
VSEYFKRQIALWGEDTQAALAQKSIAIIGCGGLGSSLGITLGSSGIGKVYLVDFDTVSIHNIHRQIAFTMADEGKSKSACLKKLIESRYDGVCVEAFEEGFDEFIKHGFEFDLLIDATDNLPSRAAMNEWAKTSKKPWLYASVEEWRGQVCFFDKASYTDLFVVNDRKPGGIAPPIVSFIAALEANFALRYLSGETIKKDELNFLSFTADGELSHKKFALAIKD